MLFRSSGARLARHRASRDNLAPDDLNSMSPGPLPSHSATVTWEQGTGPGLMLFRSSGARLSRLASAEDHWSPRCMTARSSSLCLAGFPSRVAPSSRPTGQTPTLSRRAPAFMLPHVHVLTQEKLPLFPLNSCEQSRLILLVSEKK